VLAILYFVGAIGLAIVQLNFANELNLSNPTVMASASIMVGWGILGGIGMWKGHSWGWWLGGLYLAQSTFKSGIAIYEILQITSQHPDEITDASKYYLRYIGRMIVHPLLIGYFFKSNVLKFFKFSETERKTLTKQFLGYRALLLAFILTNMNI
jgi:hypothetical protein